MDMWNCVVADRPYDWSLEDHESIDSMRERLGRVPEEVLANARKASGGRLDDTFTDTQCDPPEIITYAGMIAHVLTFAAYNRTLALLALKAAGIGDLGWGDPMRWVAEP
jgi:hypothetical protein